MTHYSVSDIKYAIVTALTTERVGGLDPIGIETTISVYPDEAAAVADEVLTTLRERQAMAVGNG